MKNALSLLFFMLLLNVLHSQCGVPEIISPNGGEALITGDETEVKFYYKPWHVGSHPYVFFSYSLDGGENWILNDSISIDTTDFSSSSIFSFPWLIPDVNSDQCIIKIKKYQSWCWDESDATFSISWFSNVTEYNDSDKSLIDIFPNPTQVNKPINIQLNSRHEGLKAIRIIGLNGDVIESLDYNKSVHHINHLSPGIYVLVLTYDDQVVSKRIIVH